MKDLIFIYLLLAVFLLEACQSDPNPNVLGDDTENWPQIALINEVWYKGGERYVHPSFEYAGTGFLLEHQDQVYAVTAKHVLWVAKPKQMETVTPNEYLEKWIMRPKGNTVDSVIVDKLINSDFSEQLQGRNSTIQDRDWLIFKTKYVSPNIHSLHTQFKAVQTGEKIYYAGCPYSDNDCSIHEAIVLSVKGNRIVFSNTRQEANIGGASGAPLIDSNGYLVGILGGTSVSPQDGSPALYGMSTHYLRKVFENDPKLNYPLVRIDDFLHSAIDQEGVDVAVAKFKSIISAEDNYYIYSIPPEQINNVAKNLLYNDRPQDAIKIIELSISEHPNFSKTHSLLGQALVATGDNKGARNSFNMALELWDENEDAIKGINELDARGSIN